VTLECAGPVHDVAPGCELHVSALLHNADVRGVPDPEQVALREIVRKLVALGFNVERGEFLVFGAGIQPEVDRRLVESIVEDVRCRRWLDIELRGPNGSGVALRLG
jgi:hypothetical protein